MNPTEKEYQDLVKAYDDMVKSYIIAHPYGEIPNNMSTEAFSRYLRYQMNLPTPPNRN